MTDFTRVNNVYYDMNVYNPLSTQVPAEIDNKLLFPLLNTSDNYSVAVAKAKIPLDSVPLTKSNIGLKLYQLGLKIGTTEEFAYVRQVNANQDNFVWNCPKGSQIITKSKYTSTGTLTQVTQQDISIYVKNVYNFVVDDYSNLFVVGSDSLSEVPNKLYVIDENNNLLQTSEYVHIKHIYIDRGQNLYICDEAPTPLVYVYGMSNGIGQVSMTLKTSLTTNHAGDPLVNLLFCVADGEILVGYNQNTITFYNAQYEPQTDIIETAITQLQNLANINATANTYVLANSNEIDDTIYGVHNQVVYNVNDNSQFTTGIVLSSLAIINPTNGYAFAIGTDNHTYAITYPPATLPANYFQVNSTTSLKAGGIWSQQNSAHLYGLSITNAYLVWNFNCGFNPPTIPNSWTSFGEIAINPTFPINPLSIDIQSSSKKLVAVGSDNNLYITSYQVAPIELLFNNLQTYQRSITLGLGTWDSQGTQENYIIRQTDAFGANIYGMFKYAGKIFVAEAITLNLNVYSQVDYLLINSYPNFDNNILNLTYLPINSLFAYFNNSDEIVIRQCASPTTSYYTLTGITYVVGDMCQLDAQHIAVCESGVNNQIYIYNFTTNTLVLTITTVSKVASLCTNFNEVVNGLPTLYAMSDSTPLKLGTNIISYTFTNNAFGGYNPPTTIYTTSNNEVIAFIDCHQTANALVFITGIVSPSFVFENVKVRTLYSYSSYSSSGMTSAPFNLDQGPFYFPKKAQAVYLNQTISSTHVWTQVTSNEQIKAISVSRSNPNKFYALGSSDSLIYTGNFLNNAVTFTQYTEFTQTYDYISNTPNINPTIQSKLYLYGLQSQNLITTLELNDECGSIARNDVTNQYVVSQRTQNKIQALNAQTLVSQFTSSLTGAYRLFVKNGSDIDAGKVDIYDMAVFINAVNNAFVEATTKINQVLGAGTITTPPSLTLDYLTGLCTLTYPQAFTQSANGILFNRNLLNLVYYQSTLDSTSGLYKLILNTQQESTTQQTKSIYNFNQLDKILFQSNCIYVVGAYFGKNQSNNIITDIDVVIGDYIENLGQTLYFQPNFLRTYALQSNLPLERIQLNILYQYRDGSEYQLYINQGQNTTVKLQMIKKF